jgi:hypothetical protein
MIDANGQWYSEMILGPCSLPFQISSFFTLSIISIFGRMHGALNVAKINN